MAKGLAWQPPFKSAMQAMGLDAAMIMDFHGDGHPSALTDIRLHELEEYYKACRAQSGKNFLLIPAEEANIILGGHWALVFPKPVYWYMDRKPEQPFESRDEKLGTIYRVHTPAEVWDMVKRERRLCIPDAPAHKRIDRLSGQDPRHGLFSRRALYRDGMEGDAIGSFVAAAGGTGIQDSGRYE